MTDGAAPMATSPDPLTAGRAALGSHDWTQAFEQYSAADRAGALSGPDLESLALAAFFVADTDAETDALERAFKAYQAQGDDLLAANIGLRLARTFGYRGKTSIASAWVSRSERLLEPGGTTTAHGYLALVRSETAAAMGDLEAALALAETATRLGRANADPDLTAWSLGNLGALKIASGETVPGLAMMEEAAISAVSGELSPITSGVTACMMISACRDMTDYRRATEWIEATERYCERQSLAGFPGICRIHRAEVTAVSGAWDRAEQELEKATHELAQYRVPPEADGWYAIGDIRRLKGDLEGAEAALREAHARGRQPQPALALIRLAEGKVKAAATSIDAAVAEASWDRWARARLLPAQVEIAIAAGDVAKARAAVDELSERVAGYSSPAMEAGRQAALGRVLIAEDDLEAGIAALRAAISGWREVGSPYEVARGRALLARALDAQGSDESAELERRAALDEFQRLGAKVDAAATDRELRDAEDRRTGPVQVRKAFMFTDIVGSTQLAEALGDQAWERLLRWHDDTLQAIARKGGGEVVNSTGDGFFIAFDSADPAIGCAIAIQQALAAHRDTAGFALPVRIGIHLAEANRRGSDYSGMGVHVAARVAALAGGWEIIATSETLDAAGATFATADAREVPIRGVSAPVTLATVTWD